MVKPDRRVKMRLNQAGSPSLGRKPGRNFVSEQTTDRGPRQASEIGRAQARHPHTVRHVFASKARPRLPAQSRNRSGHKPSTPPSATPASPSGSRRGAVKRLRFADRRGRIRAAGAGSGGLPTNAGPSRRRLRVRVPQLPFPPLSQKSRISAPARGWFASRLRHTPR
jgi:hypothetical protein